MICASGSQCLNAPVALQDTILIPATQQLPVFPVLLPAYNAHLPPSALPANQPSKHPSTTASVPPTPPPTSIPQETAANPATGSSFIAILANLS